MKKKMMILFGSKTKALFMKKKLMILFGSERKARKPPDVRRSH